MRREREREREIEKIEPLSVHLQQSGPIVATKSRIEFA